jgi:hypothetical protein
LRCTARLDIFATIAKSHRSAGLRHGDVAEGFEGLAAGEFNARSCIGGGLYHAATLSRSPAWILAGSTTACLIRCRFQVQVK